MAWSDQVPSPGIARLPPRLPRGCGVGEASGRLALLDLGAVLAAAPGEGADRLQAALEPGVELAAGDVHVQDLVGPIEVLQGGHQGMPGGVAGELPLLALAGRVFHVLAL